MKLVIVPFEKIEKKILDRLKHDLMGLFKAEVEIFKEMPLPNLSWRGEQASAHDFVLDVHEIVKEQGAAYGIGMTKRDIYDLYNSSLNYIFGFASGNSCVVSTSRLEGEFFLNRISKEAVHELGRCMGLDHCEDPECVMAYAGSVEDIDKKDRDFCDRCRAKIKK
jgi:archaemetzincin